MHAVGVTVGVAAGRWDRQRRPAQRAASAATCRQAEERPLQGKDTRDVQAGTVLSESSTGNGVLSRRVIGGAAAAALAAAAFPVQAESAAADTTITHRVFLDVGTCADRTPGGDYLCDEPEKLGRIVIGLYGKTAPQTVENFISLVTAPRGEGLTGTLIHKIVQGQYIQAGRQGLARYGQLEGLKPRPNDDTTSSAAFQLQHRLPGTVSLSLGENDDEMTAKGSANYNPVEFLITTGPAPAPSLDGLNIVFGRVLEGLDVVAAVARVPTYTPLPSARTYNAIASAIGDNRAARAREAWTKPTQAVVFTATGVLE